MFHFYFYLKRKFSLIIEYVFIIFNTYLGMISVKKILNNNNENFYYVFDLSKSSIAYGDFFHACFFLRYVSIFKEIKFIFITDKFREDAIKRISKKKIISRIKEFEDIVNILCRKKCTIIKLSWKNFILDYSKNKNIYLKSFILNRKPIYKINHQVINKIYPTLEKKIKNKILIKKEDFDKKIYRKLLIKNYISVGVRVGYLNEKKRNVSTIELINYLLMIENKNKDKKIVLVTCENGKKILKKALKKRKNIFYSKDYKKTFLEDAFIVLNSNRYYQFKGSGIGVIAEYSKLKFDICIDLNRGFKTKLVLRADQMYSKKLKNSWQNKNQRFYNIEY